MNVVLLEPFFSGSHRQWAEGLKQHSKHEVEILSLPGRHWKWRMHGGAITLAKRFQQLQAKPDLIIATDMLDLGQFLSLTRKETAQIPVAIYFHENQLTYPWSPEDEDVAMQRDNHYSFINYTSALTADKVWFNSHYHHQAFLNALPNFLKQFPDHRGRNNIEPIGAKSAVMPLGLDLNNFEKFRPEDNVANHIPIILWNHRWEYDKGPNAFFEVLFQLKEEGVKFNLVVLGERRETCPDVFDQAKEKLKEHILHWGHADTFEQYAHWLWRADILPITSYQDFFGGSVVEAMYCNCMPLLPRRLAYPEHVPADLQEQYFYNDQHDMIRRLKGWLSTSEALPRQPTQPLVKHYDWLNLIDRYDLMFEQLVK